MKKPFCLLLPLVCALPACDAGLSSAGPSCDVDEQAPAVRLTVLDSASMGPLPVEGLATVAAPGRMQQRVFPANDSTPLDFFQEQQGTYDVQVQADGYQAWETGGVRVTYADEGCTVETAFLRALMQAME